MAKIKVMTIFGVRPEAIKMAPVIKELERYPDIFDTVVTITAQHREMLDQVLELFNITADYDLNIMKQRQTLTDIFVRALKGLDEVLTKVKPDIILVHGDTATTFVGSLAAFYQKIPVGHVEAGLRTYDKYFPFPEEINRRLTGVLADLHFAPTATARDNLLSEGILPKSIYVTGNTVIDALEYTVAEHFQYRTPQLTNKPWQDGRLILMEVHRRENWGQPITDICRAARAIVKDYQDAWIVFPVHMNPVVRDAVFKELANHERIILTEPLDTDEYHNLISEAYFMLTDSGGVQEEAPAFGTPVLLTRTVTERPEAVAAGTVKVVGNKQEDVYRACKEILVDEKVYQHMSYATNPYGDGRASVRIAAAIAAHFRDDVDRPQDFSEGSA